MTNIEFGKMYILFIQKVKIKTRTDYVRPLICLYIIVKEVIGRIFQPEWIDVKDEE